MSVPKSSSKFKAFAQKWIKVEIYPLIGFIGFAVVGAGWYLTRLARGSEVVWDKKNNPYPYLEVDQDTNLKLYTGKKQFEKSYQRTKL